MVIAPSKHLEALSYNACTRGRSQSVRKTARQQQYHLLFTSALYSVVGGWVQSVWVGAICVGVYIVLTLN